MNWKGAKVLVTGAGGFIGSHLCERLANSGARVLAFDIYNTNGRVGMLQYLEPEALSKIEVVKGDLRDGAAVQKAMNGCEIIFHLGALISIPYSYSHPREVVEVNIVGTLNVLEAARKAHPERLVHTSTSEVFGTVKTGHAGESAPLHPQSPYAATKVGADKLVQAYHYAYSLPLVTIRPFNTYGPRQSGRAVIPTIVSQALHSNHIKLGALDTTRDFTFVTDTVEGFILGAHAPGVEGEEFNLGTDQEVSVKELVFLVGKLLSRELEVEIEPDRLRPAMSEVLRLRANHSKARERLGWRPTIGLDAGVQQVISWIKAHPELYKYEYEI